MGGRVRAKVGVNVGGRERGIQREEGGCKRR